MKKRIVCLTLALLMSATQVVSVSASREDELREEQAITSQQLDATYSRMDELAYAKSQLENEISELDSNLVSVMVSIDTLKGDIDNKEVDIIKTKQDLAKAQKARDKQYESMKLRIQALYEQGGDAAWFQMMLNSEDLSELLTRAENTQQMYEQDRESLQKYARTIEEVQKLEEQYQQDMENYLMRDTDVSYNSITTLKADVLGIKNVVLLVGGMIGAVFALVGLINFINLVMTNIVTRRHEFATMQSIGMTNRQLRKMMISESFSYVLLAGIVGTLVAATLGMTLLRAFVENGPTSMMMTFQITLLPALIMLILFLALAFIVPVVALRLFNNRSVVERLRVNE